MGSNHLSHQRSPGRFGEMPLVLGSIFLGTHVMKLILRSKSEGKGWGLSLVPLPPCPNLSFAREMEFCPRGGQGRVSSSSLGNSDLLLPLTGLMGSVQGCAGGREAGAGLSLGAGVSQEWKHFSAGLEEDTHPESEPFLLSQAGGKSPMPSCSASQTCAEHRQTPSSARPEREAGIARAAGNSCNKQRCCSCD